MSDRNKIYVRVVVGEMVIDVTEPPPFYDKDIPIRTEALVRRCVDEMLRLKYGKNK